MYIPIGYLAFVLLVVLSIVACLFALSYFLGTQLLKKFSIFKKEDIERVEIVFRKKGLWFLFVGKLLPAIKVFIPIPAALGRVDRRIFSAIMFSASWIWSLAFIGIGFMFGKGAGMWKSYGILLMAIATLVLFLFYRLLHSHEVNEELARRKDEK